MADTEASFNTIVDGTVKCVTPGTAVQFNAGASLGCRRVIVTAFAENVGRVCVGSSTVLASTNGARGRALASGESETFNIKDVSSLYLDALNANDGVSWLVLKGDN